MVKLVVEKDETRYIISTRRILQLIVAVLSILFAPILTAEITLYAFPWVEHVWVDLTQYDKLFAVSGTLDYRYFYLAESLGDQIIHYLRYWTFGCVVFMAYVVIIMFFLALLWIVFYICDTIFKYIVTEETWE